MNSNISSPVAVVTGGARGIGLAIAQWFLNKNYRVAILDVDKKTLLQTAQNYSDSKLFLALHTDVSQPQQVNEAVDTIEKHFGRIDAWVNNAGVAVFKPILQTTFEEWRYVLSTNLEGAFLCTQACAPVMLKNRRWQHCKYRIDFWIACEYFACGVWHQQSRIDTHYQTTSC